MTQDDGTTNAWRAPVSGDWSDAADWTTGTVPESISGATIDAAGAAYTVTVSTAEAASVLSLDSADATLELDAPLAVSSLDLIAGTIQIASTDTLAESASATLGAVAITGPGTLATTGAIDIPAAAGDTDLSLAGGLTWLNTGTVTDAAVILDGQDGSAVAIVNRAGATFDLTADGAGLIVAPFGPYATTFTNAGLLEKTAGAGLSTVGAAIDNTGTIAVTSGTLDLADGGTLAGALEASGSGTLAFSFGNFTLDTDKITAPLLIDGPTYLDLFIDTDVTLTGALTELAGLVSIVAGETLTLAGPVTIAGPYNGSAELGGPGTLVTTGQFHVAPQTTGFFANLVIGNQLDWINTGTVTDAGYIQVGLNYDNDTAVITNAAGAVFDITADDAGIANYAGTGRFDNAGLLEKTGGTGESFLDILAANTGTILAESGQLDLGGVGTLGGTLETSATGTLEVGGYFTWADPTVIGPLLIDGGVLFNAPTSLDIDLTVSSGNLDAEVDVTDSASLALISAGLTIGAGDTLTLTGPVTFEAAPTNNSSVLTGPGTLLTTGDVTIAQGLAFPAVAIAGGATWINAGTIIDAGDIAGLYTGGTASLDNLAGAVIDLTADGASIDGATNLINAGLIEKTEGTGTFSIGAAITNTGTLAVATGTLQLDGGGTLGGTIETTTGTLALAGGTFTLDAPTVSSPILLDGGTIDVTAPGSLYLPLNGTSGLLNIQADVTDTAPLDATYLIAIDAADTLTLSNSVTFGALLEGLGTLVTTGDVSVTTPAIAGGVTWVNAGAVTDSGLIGFSGSAASFINQAGAEFNLTTDEAGSAIGDIAGDIAWTFTNAGLLEKTAGTGTSTMQATLDSTGTIAVDSGTLDLVGGGTLAGTILVAGTGALELGGSFTLDIPSLAAPLLVGNYGTLTIAVPTTLSGGLHGGGSIDVAANVTETGSTDLGAYKIETGQILTLSGPTTFGDTSSYFGPVIDGPGTLLTTGSVTLPGGRTFGGPNLELDAGANWTNGGTVTDAGAIEFDYPNAGATSLTNEAGATFAITADGGLTEFYTSQQLPVLTNAGLLEKTGGTNTSVIQAAITNTGTIAATTGTLLLDGSVTGDGHIVIADGTIELAAATTGQTIDFVVPGLLRLDDPTDFTDSTITGLQAGDVIELTGDTLQSATLDAQTLAVTLANGTTIDFDVSGPAHPDQINVTGDEVTIACFHQGTHLATDRGPRLVETLSPGDLVQTHTGALRPIVWIGHRRIHCDSHPHPEKVHPVRIAAGAFGPARPDRDLILSPDHAIFRDGALIPVNLLINGTTIRQQPASRVIYFHVELATHDVILAENLPVESYLDTGNRGMFANAALVQLRPTPDATGQGDLAYPMIFDGPLLHAARAQLAMVVNAPTKRSRAS